MFNERSVFRQLHAESENGFIVLLLRDVCVRVCVGGMRVHLYFAEESVCVCVCQTGVYKSRLGPWQVYLLMYSCSESKSTDLQTDIVS